MAPISTKIFNPKRKESNWIRQYVKGSAGLNWRICGIKKDRDIWTPKHIKEFNTFMKKARQTVTTPMKVYRGTWAPSPTIQPCNDNYKTWNKPIRNCQYLSTSKNRHIGMRFARLKTSDKGFLHVMHLHPGVKIYDISKYPTDLEPSDDPIANIIKQEQEIIIYPKQWLSYRKAKTDKNKLTIVEWDVTSEKPK